MKCTACDVSSPDGYHFCPNCGQQLLLITDGHQAAAQDSDACSSEAINLNSFSTDQSLPKRKRYRIIFKLTAGLMCLCEFFCFFICALLLVMSDALLGGVGSAPSAEALTEVFLQAAACALLGTGFLMFLIQKGDPETAIVLLMAGQGTALLRLLWQLDSAFFRECFNWIIQLAVIMLFWICTEEGSVIRPKAD